LRGIEAGKNNEQIGRELGQDLRTATWPPYVADCMALSAR
jgi:hypothetical protein